MVATLVWLASLLHPGAAALAGPPGSCRVRAAALRRRLLRDGKLLSLCHPALGRVVGDLQLPRLNLPVFRERIDGLFVRVDARGRARVAGTAGWLQVPGPRLTAALRKVVSGGDRSYINLDRWPRVMRQVHDSIPIDTGTAVIIDRRAPAAKAFRVLEGLAAAYHRRVDLLVRLSRPPVIAAGRAHPEGGRPSKDGYWPHWLVPPPGALRDPQLDPGEDVVSLAPWQLRPLLFADLAARAFKRGGCRIAEDHIAWWQQRIFPPPAWGVARVRLTRDTAVHRLVQAPAAASWGQVMTALRRDPAARLRPAPAERPAVWFTTGDRLAVRRGVPEAWRSIPHYVPIPGGSSLARRIRARPRRFQVRYAGRMNVWGSLDQDIIRRILRANRPQLLSCLQLALRDRVTLRDRVEVEFMIGTNKRVMRARISAGSLRHPPTRDCLLAVFRSLGFPGRGGGLIQVRCPLEVRAASGP